MQGRWLLLRSALCACLLLAPSVAAGGAGAPEPPAEAVLAVLPFQPGDEPNRVLVDLAPEGGEPFVMMLDTGASTSLLTPLMARRLGVAVRRNKQSPYRRATRLGRDLQFWIDTASSDTGSKTGWEFGLLGGEFLDDYVIELDFPGRRVRFVDPGRYRVPESTDAEDERVAPFKLAGTRIVLPVELNGKAVDVLLDTGAPDNLILSGKAARQAGVDVDSLADFGSAGTVMGPMPVRLYETATFRLAGFEFEALPVLVAPRGWYNMGPNDSVVGYDVLRQFVVRIDYPRKRLWLKRSPGRRITWMGADYVTTKKLGAYIFPQAGALHVLRVTPGGPAEGFGLRAGDAIVAPPGEAPASLDDVLRQVEARERLTISRPQGDAWLDVQLPAESETAAP